MSPAPKSQPDSASRGTPAELALREADEIWKLALEATGDGVWDWWVQEGVETYSPRYLAMYGYTQAEIEESPEAFDTRTHPDDIAQMEQDRQAHFDGLTPSYVNEHRVRCKDGSWKWILTRGMVIARDEEGRPLRMVGTHTDITHRKESEALIWQQAHLDALTGLPNRRMLRERLERQLELGGAAGQQLAVLFVDLDHFKEVNDTLGHGKGDALLLQAAQRIRAVLRPQDTVARMGGDEFTVLMPDVAGRAEVNAVVEALIAAMAAVYLLDSERAFVSASVGIAVFPEHGREIEALFKHADQALYAAKDSGRNRYHYFTPELQAQVRMRVRLSNDLRGAVERGEFRLVYQPIVELASGRILKAEALLRWQHPQLGLITPGEFIALAENSGQIVEIGEWVFRESAAQVQAWRRTLAPQFQLSINKSPLQFRAETGVHSLWVEQLEALGLPGSALAVEITEGLLLERHSPAGEQLAHLRRAGISIALDDFGTGYSSLSYLQRYELDELKIDRSFVSNLQPGSKDLALCKAIITMAHELGMRVVAEGVETAAQRDLLLEAGCDLGQGYWFARPMAAPALERLLENSIG